MYIYVYIYISIFVEVAFDIFIRGTDGDQVFLLHIRVYT